MIPGFLAAFPAGRSAPGNLAARLARRTGLSVGLVRPRFVLLTAPGTGVLEAGQDGAVVGTLFYRHGPSRPIGALSPEEGAAAAASRGSSLLRDFWGAYVGLVASADGVRLLRDPSGAMPCLVARGEGHVLAASDVGLLMATGDVATAIDWSALAFHLYSAGLPSSRTVLAGIVELLPGFCADPENAQAQQPCWSPWDHVRATAEEEDAVAERLRRTVGSCVKAAASPFRRLLLSVSGGLDSSIVAACLADGGSELTCLTMFGDDPAGDEREYARALCSTLGLSLVERRYRVEEVDIEAPLGAHLPRPFGRTQAGA
jgi:asparagine synthase (glutamine-hydrolysing)